MEAGQGQKQGHRFADLSVTEMRGDGHLHLDERSSDKRWLDSEYILKVEPTGFTDGLAMY